MRTVLAVFLGSAALLGPRGGPERAALQSSPSGAAAWAGAAYTLVVLLAAVVRLIQVFIGGAKRSGLRRLHLLLWAPILYFTLLHCVYIGSVRYRVPLMPLLAIGAASVVTSSTSRNAAAD